MDNKTTLHFYPNKTTSIMRRTNSDIMVSQSSSSNSLHIRPADPLLKRRMIPIKTLCIGKMRNYLLLPSFNPSVLVTPIKQHSVQVMQLDPQQDKQMEIEAYINSGGMSSKLVYLKTKLDKENKIEYENIINLKRSNGKDTMTTGCTSSLGENKNNHKINHELKPYYILQHYTNGDNVDGGRDTTLIFESRFESGNLLCAFKLEDFKYNLVLQNDTNTTGYVQWFFFSISNTTKNKMISMTIINLLRKTSLYSTGLKIWCYSKKRAEKENIGWHRTCINTNYFVNNYYMYNKGQRRPFYSLTFDYEPKYDDDTIYFANSLPFLYSDLTKELNYYQIEESKFPYFHRKTLCSTLGNNDLDMITINTTYQNPSISNSAMRDTRKGIVLLARQHPGETCSSYVMKGAIDFLMGNSDEAKKLRELYLIKIIPMINIDGVIVGNSRTSFAGCDLNRRWSCPNEIIHPEIYHAKEMINRMASQREIAFVCDFHGHIGAFNSFFYCNHKDNRRDCALFPYICSKISKVINYSQCDFKMPKYKNGTGRITLFRDLNIDNIVTLETSYFGTSVLGEEKNGHCGEYFNAEMFKAIGRDVCLGMLSYYYKYENKAIDKGIGRGMIDVQMNEFEEKMSMRTIEEKDKNEEDGDENDGDGIKDESSESEPSIDNFDKDKIMSLLPNKAKKKKRKYNCKSSMGKHGSATKKILRHDYCKGEISYYNPIKSTATSNLPLFKIPPPSSKERYRQPIKLSNTVFSPKTASPSTKQHRHYCSSTKALNDSNLTKELRIIHIKPMQITEHTQVDERFLKLPYSCFENQYPIITPHAIQTTRSCTIISKSNPSAISPPSISTSTGTTTAIAIGTSTSISKSIIRNKSFTSNYRKTNHKSINSLINNNLNNLANINNNNMNNIPPLIVRVNSNQFPMQTSKDFAQINSRNYMYK